MVVAGSSSRLLRATTKAAAFNKDTTRKSSSSSTSSGGEPSSSPVRIPSLKFPFPWEAANKTHRTTSRRGAEQRAALISLGATTASNVPERKKMGVLLSEEAKSVDLLVPLAYEVTRRLVLRQFRSMWQAVNGTCWTKVAEAAIHRAVVSCQSFTLIGVAGSLLGSVPCFVKGCVLVVYSFFMRFQAMSHAADEQAEIMEVLIHALDMFLIGTALLTFAMGLYTMFYGSKSFHRPGQHINSSQLGTFNLKKLKGAASISCITQAKTRIGHAVVLLLQAGVLEKFKSVPLSTGLDVACFAGAVLASSAGVFLLSRLTGREQRSKAATFA